MDEIDPILLKIDSLIRLSRLKEIEFVMNTDLAERVRVIKAAVQQLWRGEYLLGTGPSTVGIIPLTMDEVVLGRLPTIFEGPAESVAEFPAVDTLYFAPREVSRAHAKVIRQTADPATPHILVDLNSTCGTFVNETQLPPDTAVPLAHGDVISLGPSQTSTYVYYRVTQVKPRTDFRIDQSDISWVWMPESDSD